ncbi:MAG: AI-2E family transporter [Thermomicrobiales bacterium]
MAQERRVPRQAGVLLIYLLLIGILAGIVLLLIPLVSAEVATADEEIPKYQTRVEDFVNRVAPNRDFHLSFSSVSDSLSNNLDTLAVRLTEVTISTGRGLVLLFVTLVISYYLAVRPDLVPRAIIRFLPEAHHSRVETIDESARNRIGGWARGQALVALSFGTAMGLGLWIIGVPFAISLGVIAAVLEVIPYIGGVVTILLAVPLALTVGPGHAIAAFVLYIVLAQIEAHIVMPYFLGRGVELPPVVVLIALLAGAEVAGIIGILLAVPVSVVIWAIVEEIWPPRIDRAPELSENATESEGRT